MPLPGTVLAVRASTNRPASGRDGKAEMGDYNRFMTIQELVDLVAFLREPGGAR
jgi:hypothetical protein